MKVPIEQILWSAVKKLPASDAYNSSNIPSDGVVKSDILRMLELVHRTSLNKSFGGPGISETEKQLASQNLLTINKYIAVVQGRQTQRNREQ